MSFNKKTIKEFDLAGKKVLLRADYNVPMSDGKITSDFRLRQSLPTIEYLLQQNCSIIIISHLGRPDGQPNTKFSLKPVAKKLANLLKKPVDFIEDCQGDVVKNRCYDLQPGQILMLENLRFYAQEEANDRQFAQYLAELAEVFVQDGFGVVHRAHASTVAICEFLPSLAGLLLEKEVLTITTALENPQRPLAAIVGGAKISDKIDVLSKLIDIADFVAIGGAMANTFLWAKGIDVGKSLIEKSERQTARDILAKAEAKAAKQPFVFYLPQDGVVASQISKSAKTRIVDWGSHLYADISAYPNRPKTQALAVSTDEMILDIGSFSAAFIAGGIQLAQTVVWNGSLGITETAGLQGPIGPFAHGTEIVIEALLGQFGHKPFSVIGGGDTVSYLEERQILDGFSHVSTGGGASLELMAGKQLPGVESLWNKD